MIKDFELYHGVVFSRILHALHKPVSIKPFPSPSNASYVLDEKIGLYIKYSTKRMTPWRFSVLSEHQLEMIAMQKNLGHLFLILVCNNDGIVCLGQNEIAKILNLQQGTNEWISVSRGRRQMYSVAGSDGRLAFKIGNSDFPNKIFNQNIEFPDLVLEEKSPLTHREI